MPRTDRDPTSVMDTDNNPIEATKASYPCKCQNCPQMARPEEQLCCLGESQWQDFYNTGGT